jgi:hypothetical protein
MYPPSALPEGSFRQTSYTRLFGKQLYDWELVLHSMCQFTMKTCFFHVNHTDHVFSPSVTVVIALRAVLVACITVPQFHFDYSSVDALCQ